MYSVQYNLELGISRMAGILVYGATQYIYRYTLLSFCVYRESDIYIVKGAFLS